VVVTNSSRTTAIVIRNDGHKVTLVPMTSGKLAAVTIDFAAFRAEWTETDYALSRALSSFMAHVREWGATAEASRGLTKLEARDRLVPSLF
jgi:hypothetical protein